MEGRTAKEMLDELAKKISSLEAENASFKSQLGAGNPNASLGSTPTPSQAPKDPDVPSLTSNPTAPKPSQELVELRNEVKELRERCRELETTVSQMEKAEPVTNFCFLDLKRDTKKLIVPLMHGPLGQLYERIAALESAYGGLYNGIEGPEVKINTNVKLDARRVMYESIKDAQDKVEREEVAEDVAKGKQPDAQASTQD